MLRPMDVSPKPAAGVLAFSALYWPVGTFVSWRAKKLVHAVYYVYHPLPTHVPGAAERRGDWRRHSVCNTSPRGVWVEDPPNLHGLSWTPFDISDRDACPRCVLRVYRYRERMGIE